MPKAKQLTAWLSKLDRHPPAFPATLAALGGFGASAALLGSASIPKPVGYTAIAALGAVAGWLAQQGEPLLEVEMPPGQDLWVDIPGGSFLMGSPPEEEDRREDEGPQHEVELSAFQMMRVPVTRELYRMVIGSDPGWPMKGPNLPKRPINNVSWYDALHFCNALSALEGRQPAYTAADGRPGPFAEGSGISWNRSADGYCLPTEAQWEYACRAGSKTRFCCGDEETQLLDYAWYRANSAGETQPVGRKKANAWGLHDLHGNVWEWCWDTDAPYVAERKRDPVGPEDRSVLRPVVRGGSSGNEAWRLRSAYRYRNQPMNRFRGLGFRCVRVSRPAFGLSVS